MVEDIIRENGNMGIECKAMLQSIIQDKRIFILPNPNKMEKNRLKNFREGILQVKPTMISADASISLSYEAKSMIEDLSNHVTNSINSNSKAIRG